MCTNLVTNSYEAWQIPNLKDGVELETQGRADVQV